MLAWISCENSTTHEECWFILTGLPSLLLHSPSCQLVSLLSGVDWPLASPFTNCLLSVPLSNSSRVPLPTSGHVELSSPNPLSGFAPKQTKRSSAWQTTYIVLHPVLELWGMWSTPWKSMAFHDDLLYVHSFFCFFVVFFCCFFFCNRFCSHLFLWGWMPF